MASYGGYGGGGGGGGGEGAGFFQNSSQQGSQSGSKTYAEESLRPITLKQLIEAEETHPSSNEYLIDGHPVSQLTFVGQVRSVQRQETNLQYKIDDGTAIIEVKKFIDVDRDRAAAEDSMMGEDGEENKTGGHGSLPVEMDSFVRVYGRLKSFSNKRYITANFIRALPDVDEMHYHLLEATAVHLHFTKGPLSADGGGGGVGGARNGGDGDGMFVGGGYGAGDGGGGDQRREITGGPAVKKMFSYMQTAPGGNEGLHVNVLAQGLAMSSRDVMAAADNLLSQGLIYTTVDEETWAVLDY